MHTLELKDGLRIGDQLHREVELRRVTAADIFAAQDAAESLVLAPGHNGAPPEPMLVVSPAKMGRHLLMRQIVRIGEVQADALDEGVIGRLSAEDLALIESAAGLLESAATNALKRNTDRGRDEGAGSST